MTRTTPPGSGTTLAYAEPAAQPVFPLRWALTALAIFAIAMIVERGCIWLILLSILRDRGQFAFGLRDVVDYVLPPIVAGALLCVVLLEQREVTPRLTRLLIVLCTMQVVLAVASIACWSATVLPLVWRGRGVHDGVVWEAELIYVRLLPVAWPLVVMGIAAFGLPTRRDAAAALTVWSIATWTCAASATAALWHERGRRTFSISVYGYTVMPAWTFMLIPIAAVGLALWIGVMPPRLRGIACLLASIFWIAAAMLHAWFDESMSSVRGGRFAELANLANLGGVVGHLITTLILWQIAPMALLAFLARPRRA